MNEKRAFLKGAVTLTAANIISKILGAVFKIPLTYILKEEGMAVFNTASCVYSIFLTFIISGIPLAASRLVAADYALDKPQDAAKTTSAAARLLFMLGLIGSVILFVLSAPLAIAMKDPAAALSIKVISPSLFFVAVGCAYKSFFQGTANMIPTAISQVTESAIRLFVGFFAAYLFINSPVMLKSAGATAGVTLGELVATAILFLMYIFTKKTSKKKSTLTYKKIFSDISAVAVPMLFSSVILSALNMVDVATVRNRLLRISFSPETAERFLMQFSSHTKLFDNLFETLRLSPDSARWLYGAYSGYALTIFHLPLGVLATLGVTILPVVTANLAKHNMTAVRSLSKNAITLTLFLSVPFSVLFLTESDMLLKLLFNNTASATMLSCVSPCLIFLALSQLFSSILYSSGRIIEPFFIQLIGVTVKIIGNIILVPIASLHIYGAILSSTISFCLSAILEWRLIRKSFGVNICFKDVFPFFISALPMFAVSVLTKQPLSIMLKYNFLALAASSLLSLFAYILSLSFFFPKGFGFLKKNK